MDISSSCQGDDDRMHTFVDFSSAHGIFLSPVADGLGLSFTGTTCPEQAHLSTMSPHTPQDFFHGYYSPPIAGTFHTPEPMWQVDLPISSMTEQTAWPVSVYHTPISGSPVHSHIQEAIGNAFEAVPGLYTSPGSTIASTICETPSSISSAGETKVLNGLVVTQGTPGEHFQWYTPAQSPAVLPMVPFRTLVHPNYPPIIPESPATPVLTISAAEGIKEEEEPDQCLLQRLTHEERLSRSPRVRSASLSTEESQDTPLDPTQSAGIEERFALMEEKTKLKRQRQRSDRSATHRPACPKCFKSFSRKHNLDQHLTTSCPMNARDKVKPFKCHYAGCRHPFDRRHDLERHVNSKHLKALEEVKHACDVCGQKFPRKDTLRRHWKNKCRIKTRAGEAEAEQLDIAQQARDDPQAQSQLRSIRPSNAKI